MSENYESFSFEISFQGAKGQFVQLIGRLFQLCPMSDDMLFRISLPNAGGYYPLTVKMFHIMLAGIVFHPKDHSATALRKKPMHDRWLTDEHINLIRALVRLNRVQSSMNTIPRSFSPTSVCLTTYFYPKLMHEKHEALSWLKEALYDQNLLSDSRFDADEILIPINLSNTHWILAFLDFKHSTFFAINPYYPGDPTEKESDMVKFIADCLSDEFGRSRFKE